MMIVVAWGRRREHKYNPSCNDGKKKNVFMVEKCEKEHYSTDIQTLNHGMVPNLNSKLDMT